MLTVSSTKGWPSGYAINTIPSRVEARWIDAFSNIPTAIISDCLGRNVGGLGLRPYHGRGTMIGSAVTVRVRPGDNLMTLKAIQLVQPGDILVIDGSGDQTRALIGGIMRAMAIKAGIAGIIVNGALRDSDDWLDGRMPVYALGCVHRGPSTDGPGEINVPVSCAGLVVNPGDLVVGDSDGVVSLSANQFETVHQRSVELLEREASIIKAIEDNTLDPDRFNAILRSKGCPL
ncbi:RraA famliy [Pseudomonas cedrina]|uniref:Putative 4-hydroxy-4-methyl-2-oxoglutarate aldolase n=2 Tax=Pseudomonas cedrina TaxID=651740 RepID=A0A1V2K3B0_PSECE|nr:RraA family protein [Pseudomonas cedrina]ONH51586.1 methyltransferase [Pseudomonas cedrina subsp. cedrina]SDT11665.1 RraA famliy [Pseudomonas cedrina]